MNVADDRNVLQRARIRTVEKDTSANRVTRAPEPRGGASRRRQAAVRRLLFLSEAAKTARGTTRWTRDELHDR